MVVRVDETWESEGAHKIEGRFEWKGKAGVRVSRFRRPDGGDLAVKDPEVMETIQETIFIQKTKVIEAHPVLLGEGRK